MTDARSALDLPPILAAPMAGGPSGPELVEAAAAAGFFGFLAGGYRTVGAVQAQIARVRENGASFGVNLFVPHPGGFDRAAIERYAMRLAPFAARYDVAVGQPRDDDDDWQAKVDLLTNDPAPVVSFTFGVPDAKAVRALRRAGSLTVQSVTTADEGHRAAEAGVDALVVQGVDAGGHSATLDPAVTPTRIRLADLVRTVATRTGLPVIAAGGLSTPEHVRAVIAAGASAVMIGTALLRSPEAGTAEVHRRALRAAGPDATVLTRAFTGRPARALRNRFVDLFDEDAPTAYPAVHHLTEPVRRAAAARGDEAGVHLWAGTGYSAATDDPAAATLARLASLL